MSEREHNDLEFECDRLKRLAKITKKGELQSRIDRRNQEIDLLKVRLSKITKRYGFHIMHDFYKVYVSAKTAYAYYRNKSDKCEESYGKNIQKQEKESVYK